MVTWVGFLLAGLALAERPVWDEEQLVEVTEALDVLPWHQYVLRTQQMTDKPGTFVELAFHGAPARYELPNGVERNGSLVRFGIGMGLGVGKPRTGFAAFGGLLIDYGMAQGSSPISSEETLGAAVDGIFYGGMAFKGWTATVSGLARQPFTFAPEVGGPTESQDIDVPVAFTFYNQEGVALGAIKSTDASGRAVLANLRGEFRPELLLERMDLRKYGVFGLGLSRFAENLDIYQEHPPGERIPATYELPLAADDLVETGLRATLTPEIAPSPTVRRAQLGYVFASDKLVLGTQGGLLNRANKLSPSIQAYTAFRPDWFKYFSPWGSPRITVSYAYNVPDPVSFFQVDGAHVIGVQYIYGREEFARPLLPIYRSTQELEDAAQEGGGRGDG